MLLHIGHQFIHHHQDVQKQGLDFFWVCAFLQPVAVQVGQDVETPNVILHAFGGREQVFLQVDVVFRAGEQVVAKQQVSVLLGVVQFQALIKAMVEFVLQLLVLLADADVLLDLAEDDNGPVKQHLALEGEAASEVFPPHLLADLAPPLC